MKKALQDVSNLSVDSKAYINKQLQAEVDRKLSVKPCTLDEVHQEIYNSVMSIAKITKNHSGFFGVSFTALIPFIREEWNIGKADAEQDKYSDDTMSKRMNQYL